jgi:hypothetical protein
MDLTYIFVIDSFDEYNLKCNQKAHHEGVLKKQTFLNPLIRSLLSYTSPPIDGNDRTSRLYETKQYFFN